MLTKDVLQGSLNDKPNVRKILARIKEEYAKENMEILQTAAYFKWEKAGCPEGQDVKFWLEAEQESKK